MHRLFQQQIDRCGEHPMAELPRGQLTQRNVVDAANEVWFAECSRSDQPAQSRECGMVQEILVDAEWCTAARSRLQQCGTVRAGCTERLLQQHRSACLQH